MDTPSPDEIDDVLQTLSVAVQRVAELRQSTFDAFATEQAARDLLFHRLADVIAPALSAIAERTEEDPDGCTFYLKVDERKGKVWYLGRKGDATFVAAAPSAPRSRADPSVVPTADALRVISLDELVRRAAVRLRMAPMAHRRDEARRIARIMDAVQVLLEA